MSGSGSPDQQSLEAFGSNETGKISTDSSSRPASSSASTKKGPLMRLYEALSDAAEERFPEAAQEISISKNIEPETRRHTTKDIPNSVPALPLKVGQWNLTVSNRECVIYATSGDAYDYRWGEGGALCGIEVYLNNRHTNKDEKYHRRVSTVVGFKNGDQIKRKSVDSKSDLVTVRGHNVGKNDGDYGYSSGTKTKTGTAKEAVIELLLHLHHNPGPFGRYVKIETSTDWSLDKLSPRSVTWAADGPARNGDDTLKLSVRDDKLSIKSNNEGQPAHMKSYYNLPILETISDSLVEERGKVHKFKTPAAAITAANDLLSEPPAESVAAGRVE